MCIMLVPDVPMMLSAGPWDYNLNNYTAHYKPAIFTLTLEKLREIGRLIDSYHTKKESSNRKKCLIQIQRCLIKSQEFGDEKLQHVSHMMDMVCDNIVWAVGKSWLAPISFNNNGISIFFDHWLLGWKPQLTDVLFVGWYKKSPGSHWNGVSWTEEWPDTEHANKTRNTRWTLLMTHRQYTLFC